MYSDIFRQELSYILNADLRNVVADVLNNCVPKYFFEISASSTGKYHPWYSLGYGGLVRHTKAAVKIAVDLLSLEQNECLPRDRIIASLILHDTFKHGVTFGEYSVFEHPLVAAENIHKYVKMTCPKMVNEMLNVCELISTHMGQWTTYANKELLPKPVTPAQQFVHTCDYLASRKYIIVEVY